MKGSRCVAMLAGAAMIASCGGGESGGGSSGTISAAPAPTPTPTPATASSGCSLRARQDWAFATLNEWYLFPDTLPASLDPSPYADVQSYIDALTATARAQRKDRYFTYITSIAEENAYYSSGATAGFGVRLSFDASGRLFIAEAFENAPALAAGIDRGSEIVAIGTSEGNLQTVTSLIASGGSAAVSNALGPSTAGTTRVLQVRDTAGASRTVTVSKTDYSLDPVSSRYGGKIITDNGERIGYVNLRTFISPANDGLKAAFASFKAAGVNKVIVDLRYNGGGLVSVAELFTNLLGANRSASDVQSYTTFRPSKSAQNETTFFTSQTQSVAPLKVAFIGTGSTASASEYVINAVVPYLHANAALVGSNTYGKPVGQIALDNPGCTDDRLRVIAFALQNANRVGDYYDGLASKVEASCQASDDLSHQLGDPAEASTRAALDFVEGKSCTRIGASAAAARTAGLNAPERTLLVPANASTMQRETPGAF